MIKLFDSHCHLQDPRILNVAPKLIKEAIDAGVVHFAVNGVSEKDWHIVKQMSDRYPSVIPNFGLHPWFISDRTPDWLETLKEFLTANPTAAVGEIGLDKGSIGKQIDFTDQVEVFRQQLLLAREVQRPASVHCVRAFADLLEILKSVGPFSSGVILHSYLGSAEMVPQLSDLGAYFSFSGFLMSMKESKAKRMLKSVPIERILLETDAPDARPKSVNPDSLFLIEREVFNPGETNSDENISSSNDVDSVSRDELEESGNHPANIHHVLAYVARLLEMEERELAELSYQNATLPKRKDETPISTGGVQIECYNYHKRGHIQYECPEKKKKKEFKKKALVAEEKTKDKEESYDNELFSDNEEETYISLMTQSGDEVKVQLESLPRGDMARQMASSDIAGGCVVLELLCLFGVVLVLLE